MTTKKRTHQVLTKERKENPIPVPPHHAKILATLAKCDLRSSRLDAALSLLNVLSIREWRLIGDFVRFQAVLSDESIRVYDISLSKFQDLRKLVTHGVPVPLSSLYGKHRNHQVDKEAN